MSNLDLSTPDRVYWQYRDKPKLQQIIKTYLDIFDTLKQAANQIRSLHDIDKNTGKQLDDIGSILNVKRPFITIDGVTELLEDTYYKILLKAKAAKGASNTTLDNYVELLEYITNSKVHVADYKNMSFRIVFEKNMTDKDKVFFDNFDVIPAPLGVEYLGYTEIEAITVHGRDSYAANYKQHTKETEQ